MREKECLTASLKNPLKIDHLTFVLITGLAPVTFLAGRCRARQPLPTQHALRVHLLGLVLLTVTARARRGSTWVLASVHPVPGCTFRDDFSVGSAVVAVAKPSQAGRATAGICGARGNRVHLQVTSCCSIRLPRPDNCASLAMHVFNFI